MSENPDIEDASYVHAADYYAGRDAGHLIRYLWRRPSDKRRPRGDGPGSWRTIPQHHRIGDSAAFTAEADSRTAFVWEYHKRRGTTIAANRAAWAASYVHIVISPANRADLESEQIAALSEPWITDTDGRTLPHVGAVHTDGRRGMHLHIAVARDKFGRAELADLQNATRGMSRQMAREMERERTQEITRGMEHERG